MTAIITQIEQETFARDGGPTRTKAVLFFKGGTKGVVVNKTNATTLYAAFGDFPDWIGKAITIKPETTMFNGKMVKALRLYPLTPKIPEPPPEEIDDEEIPF